MKRLSISAMTLALATPAFAHVDPAEHGSFLAGMTHPVFGLDHVLAMVAVGLLAATMAGRAVWSVPAAFVGFMAVGFALALAGLSLPMAEPMILASGIVIGGLVVAALRLPMPAAAGLVGLFGLFHGFAHGAEIGAASALPYALGFLTATALLHVTGVLAALALCAGLEGRRGLTAVRVLGGVATLGAVALAVA